MSLDISALPLRRLPPIQIYQATDDLFLPDARKLRDRVIEAGGDVALHEAPGFHVFMAATFTPEAREVFDTVRAHLDVARR